MREKKWREKEYVIMWKGSWIVEADSKKELIAKINSPNFSNAIEQVKKITKLLEKAEDKTIELEELTKQ